MPKSIVLIFLLTFLNGCFGIGGSKFQPKPEVYQEFSVKNNNEAGALPVTLRAFENVSLPLKLQNDIRSSKRYLYSNDNVLIEVIYFRDRYNFVSIAFYVTPEAGRSEDKISEEISLNLAIMDIKNNPLFLVR